MVLRTVASGG